MHLNQGKELAFARRLAKSGKLDDAWKVVDRWMDEAPDSANVISLASYILFETKQYGIAYQTAKRAAELEPNKSEPWTNLGRAAKELWHIEEAEHAFRKSIETAETRDLKAAGYINLSAILNDTGRFTEAEKAAFEAVSMMPNNDKARGNYGIALLGQQKWEGWDFYRATIGSNFRLKVPAGQEPDWDGEKGKTVFIYGEQGLGDEISFSSMVPKAIEDCKRVIVECDPKLEGLFARSFKGAKVYGTRKMTRRWDAEDTAPDACLAIGDLGRFYCRETPKGEPYLVADPERRLMWRALFATKKRPVIGIAWTGGVRHTGAKLREVTLEDMLPILKSVDAHWVCLQYRDAQHEIDEFRKLHRGIDIVQYPWATLSKDYDDTAALVAECDFVVSMQTAVVHLCGALGKDCYTLLPMNSQWRYGENSDRTCWYQSVRLFRQKERNEWKQPIHRIKDELGRRYRAIEAA